MLPHVDSESDVPDRATVPKTSKPKVWKYWDDKVLPQLKAFYSKNSRYPVVIPAADWDEMNNFIVNGPSPNEPPLWINWDRTIPPTGPAVEPVVPPEQQVPPPPSKRKWKPFMQPRPRKRKRKGPAKKFPYPVGTTIAKNFGKSTYAGETLTLPQPPKPGP